PYVVANGLGMVYHPHSIVQHDGSRVEPDLMVRSPLIMDDIPWDDQPLPILVIEILSPSNRAAHRAKKRTFYLRVAVPEYWVVDPVQRCITSMRPGRADITTTGVATWHPAGAKDALAINLHALFAGC